MKTLIVVLCLGILSCGLAYAGEIQDLTPGIAKTVIKSHVLPSLAHSSRSVSGNRLDDSVVPFPEGYESAVIPNPPTDWLFLDENADGYPWETTDGASYTGAQASLYLYNSAEAADDWQISPAVELTAMTSYRLSFWVLTSPWYPEAYEVKYGPGPAPYELTEVIAGPTTLMLDDWIQQVYDFTPLATGPYYIGFHCISDADEYYFVIDDIDLTLTPTSGRCCHGSPIQCTDGIDAAACADLDGEYTPGLTCETPCTIPCNEQVLCGPSAEVEPNESCPPPTEQTVISCDMTVYGLLCPEEDFDFYKVVVPAGYRMTLRPFDGPDCLTNPSTCVSTDVYYDDCTLAGGGSEAGWNLSNPGTEPWVVYLKVHGNELCRGAYKLVATCCVLRNYCQYPINIPGVFHYEQTVNTCCATRVYESTPQDLCAEPSWSSGLQVIFNFCLLSTGTLTLNVIGPSNADEQMLVFTDCADPVGSCVGSQDMESSALYGETISDLILPAGCYFVGISYYSYNGTACGDLTLTIDSDVKLPVELLGFDAVPGDAQVLLRWQTASETGSDRFEIERNGAFVHRTPAVGDATGHSYSWTDRDVTNGQSYHYALWSVELSGERSLLRETDATPIQGNATVTEYALHGNYPNPFNPVTEIAFDLPAAGTVSLKVFDLMGREVAVLVNGEKPAGQHTISFDARDLPSGMYLCRMTAGDFTASRKMMLIR